jgi:hypothetical protein
MHGSRDPLTQLWDLDRVGWLQGRAFRQFFFPHSAPVFLEPRSKVMAVNNAASPRQNAAAAAVSSSPSPPHSSPSAHLRSPSYYINKMKKPITIYTSDHPNLPNIAQLIFDHGRETPDDVAFLIPNTGRTDWVSCSWKTYVRSFLFSFFCARVCSCFPRAVGARCTCLYITPLKLSHAHTVP